MTTKPLLSWPGYPPAFEDIVRSQVLPGERVVAGPAPWLTPPRSLYYPDALPPGVGGQFNVTLLVTDRALYSFAISGNPPQISGKSRTGLQEISTVTHGMRVRWDRYPRGIFAKAEGVVLLAVAYANGKQDQWETRYDEAGVLAIELERAAAAVSGVGGGSGPSMADELAKLSTLASEGALSQDEWERAKALYLGKPPDQRGQDLAMLGQLHSLFRSGVLSESEFNSKKWEILARRS